MEENESLFRGQVQEYRLPRRYGSPLAGQPLSLRLYCLIFLLLVAVVGVFVYRAGFKTTVTVQGVLAPVQGVVRVGSRWQGHYTEVLVNEGDEVAAGQVLARVSRERHDQRGVGRSHAEAAFAERRIGQLRREIRLLERSASQQLRELSLNAENAGRQIDLLEQELSLLSRRVALSAAQLSAQQRLLDNASIAETDYQQQRAAHLALQQQERQLELRLAERRHGLTELALTREAIVLDLEQGRLDLGGGITRLEYEASVSRDDALMAIVAPTSGIAGPVTVQAGDVSRSGQVLLSIMPRQAELEARLYLPGSATALVAAGQEVLLSYEAYPFQTYGNHSGEVLSLARTTLDPRERELPLPELQEPVYLLRASLPAQFLRSDGEVHELLPGMRLRAEIVTAQMSILEYILDPVLRLLRK